ncbi:hypothetical protein [Dictyobacter arantiisoli]|uniref:hypothetical protein n=1 Tax=Dictyobacter arantiisoli TaxID=2014874 RepID=UPI0011EC19CE|nr:hypothetical protein [Dictyobacter arantiisoli]
MIIDTIMALWNHIWFSRLKRVIATCLLLGVGGIVILTLVGLPVFSQSSNRHKQTVQAEQMPPATDSSIATQPHPGMLITPTSTKIASETPTLTQPFPVPIPAPSTNPLTQPTPVVIEPTFPFLPVAPAPITAPVFPFYPSQIKQPLRHTTPQSMPARPIHAPHLFLPIGTPTVPVLPTTVPTQPAAPTAPPVPVPTPGADASPTSGNSPVPSMTGTIPVSPAPTPQDTTPPTNSPTSHIALLVA